MTISLAWNSVQDLAGAFFGVLVPTVVSIVRTGLWNLFITLIEVITNIQNIAEIGFGKLYSLISIPVNIAYLAQMFQRLDQLGAF